MNAVGKTWKDYDQDLGGEQNYLQHPYTLFALRDRARAGGRRLRRAGHLGQQPDHRPYSTSRHRAGTSPATPGAQNLAVGRYRLHRSIRRQAQPGPVVRVAHRPGQQRRHARRHRSTSRPTAARTATPITSSTSTTRRTGLVADLIHNTVPAFSWITPDNCSDAHDAVCKGNNLSGAFNADGSPNYETGTSYAYRPRDDPTGELHRRPLRLGPLPRVLHPAHRAVPRVPRRRPDRRHLRRRLPAVHLHRRQLQQRQRLRADLLRPAEREPQASRPTRPARTSSAGTSTPSRPDPTRPWRPTAAGDQLYPGPGNNAFIDRPPACTSTCPADARRTACRASSEAARATPRAPAPTAAQPGSASSSIIEDNSIVADDTGREVTGTNIPANSFVGRRHRHRAAVPDDEHADRPRSAPSSSSTRAVTRSTRPVRSAGSPSAPKERRAS